MAENQKRKPGRLPQIDTQLRIDTVLQFKDQIITIEGGIASKDSKVWIDIVEKFSNSIKPITIYNNVVNNNYGLRNLLFVNNQHQVTDDGEIDISNQDLTVNDVVDSSFNESVKDTPIKKRTSLKVHL